MKKALQQSARITRTRYPYSAVSSRKHKRVTGSSSNAGTPSSCTRSRNSGARPGAEYIREPRYSNEFKLQTITSSYSCSQNWRTFPQLRTWRPITHVQKTSYVTLTMKLVLRSTGFGVTVGDDNCFPFHLLAKCAVSASDQYLILNRVLPYLGLSSNLELMLTYAGPTPHALHEEIA